MAHVPLHPLGAHISYLKTKVRLSKSFKTVACLALEHAAIPIPSLPCPQHQPGYKQHPSGFSSPQTYSHYPNNAHHKTRLQTTLSSAYQRKTEQRTLWLCPSGEQVHIWPAGTWTSSQSPFISPIQFQRHLLANSSVPNIPLKTSMHHTSFEIHLNHLPLLLNLLCAFLPSSTSFKPTTIKSLLSHLSLIHYLVYRIQLTLPSKPLCSLHQVSVQAFRLKKLSSVCSPAASFPNSLYLTINWERVVRI